MTWNILTIHSDGYPIKIYSNQDDTCSVVFPLFGRYYRILSSNSATSMAIAFILHSPRHEMTHVQYLSSQEDTNVIQLEAA